MYEFLPPVARYGLLVALYLFLYLAYRGLMKGETAGRQVGPVAQSVHRPRAGRLIVVHAGVSSAGNVGREHPLLSSNTLGRSEDATVQVDDRFASKSHAALTFEDGDYVLTDLRSRNGTAVNGARITSPVVLSDGDRIEIGSTVYEFRF